MKYLFFDIECSAVGKNVAKICAFGYCLTDEKFNILEKEDLLINPQGRFHLTDKKGTQGIVLPYKYSDFKNYPTFQEYADRIYALLQDKDTLVAGHATTNDVKYLNLESIRFSLPSFSFDFADTQFIYMNVVKDFTRQLGLGAIATELGVEFVAHRAVDDAYATMKIAEAMCKEEGLTFSQLLEKYEITLGRIENYEIALNTSRAYVEYKALQEKKKEAREQKKAEFYRFFDREKRKRKKEGKLKGKAVCFSHPLEIELAISKKLLSAIFAEAGFFTSHAEECDIYVCFENENGARLKSVLERQSKVMFVQDFAQFLGVELG